VIFYQIDQITETHTPMNCFTWLRQNQSKLLQKVSKVTYLQMVHKLPQNIHHNKQSTDTSDTHSDNLTTTTDIKLTKIRCDALKTRRGTSRGDLKPRRRIADPVAVLTPDVATKRRQAAISTRQTLAIVTTTTLVSLHLSRLLKGIHFRGL